MGNRPSFSVGRISYEHEAGAAKDHAGDSLSDFSQIVQDQLRWRRGCLNHFTVVEVPGFAKSARRLLENIVRMSLTYFCPSCWHEVGAVSLCPNCGADLHAFSGKSYEEKLILALSHPEPTVPVRAAGILGELGSLAAVESLIDLASASTDPYIQEAAVEALGRIGDSRALPCLDRLSREGAVRVRAAAELAVRAIQERPRSNNG